MVNDVMAQREKEINKEFEKGHDEDLGDRWAVYRSQAQMFEALDTSRKEEVKGGVVTTSEQEEKKGGDKAKAAKKEGSVDMQGAINEAVESRPWIKEMQKEGSKAQTMLANTNQYLNKRCRILIMLWNLIDTDTELKDITLLPGLDGNQHLLFGIYFQNMMHPKNSHRREAITSGQYVELTTEAIASDYLSKILTQNLKIEFAGRESAIRSQFQLAASSKSAELFLETPDIYLAAAVMVQEGFYIGKGDSKAIVRGIVKNGQQYKAVKDKLKLIIMGSFFGTHLYRDNFKVYPARFNQSAHTKKYNAVHKLWISLVRQKQVLTNEEFIEVFPDHKQAAEMWIECLDYDGKPTLNKKKFDEYLANSRRRVKKAKLQAQGKKQRKAKF